MLTTHVKDNLKDTELCAGARHQGGLPRLVARISSASLGECSPSHVKDDSKDTELCAGATCTKEDDTATCCKAIPSDPASSPSPSSPPSKSSLSSDTSTPSDDSGTPSDDSGTLPDDSGNTGVIIGGVVGGLALIGVVSFVLMRKKKAGENAPGLTKVASSESDGEKLRSWSQ